MVRLGGSRNASISYSIWVREEAPNQAIGQADCRLGKRVIFTMSGVDFATSFCSPLARSSLWYARIFSSWRPPAYTIILFLYYAYHGVLFQYTLEVFFLVALPLTLYLGRTRKRPHWSLHSSPLLKSENPNQNILFPRGHRFLWSTSCWNNRRVQVHDHRKRETERVSLRA